MRLRIWMFVFTLCVGMAMAQIARAQAGTFTAIGSLNTPRTGHTATLLGSGQVLVAGGGSNSGITATAELYTPSTKVFSYTGNLSTARGLHTATLLNNGQVLIVGGMTGGTSSTATATAELYNPATGQFSHTGSLNTARYNASATLLSNGEVLVVGGDNSSGVALSTAELYNPTTGTFSYTAGNLNTARAGQSATLLGNGNVLVGGALLVYNNGNIVSSLELFDAATGTFSYTGSSGVVYGLPALLGNGNVLFLGFGTFSSELYNTATGTVSTAESYSSSPTSVYTQTSLYDGTTLVAGGEVAASGRFGGYGSTNVAGIYNTASGTTSSTGSLNYSRALHTATLLGNGQVLIAGGSGGACGRGGCSFSLVGPGELYSAPGIMGYFNPKYVVVGVTYAPPGSSSTVTYGGSTTVGNTTSTQSSFQSGLKVNVSVTKDISAWLIIGGVAVKIANSESSDSTQTSNSSTTVTTSKTSGVTFQTSGTPNCAPVNHDYDTIWLWLNPLTIYSVNPSTGAVQWNGYGYDNHDPSGNGGRDIFPVQVGYLNGDFQDDPSVDTVLARGWVTQYENLTWPAGQGPGLTSADKANILAADPFTNPSYSLPEPLPLTSPDLRFTEDPFNPGGPNPVAYSGDAGLTTNYNTATVNTESDSNGQTQSFQQQFGTDVQFSGGTWLAKMTVDIQTTDTLQWTYSWLDTLTTSQTYTDTLSVKEPTGCVNYTGPAQFLVYQDNHYGTYMFYPGN